MDLGKVITFLEKFSIRDRDSHARIPFRLNYNQKAIHKVAYKQQQKGKPIRIVVDKARRVGVSSWTEGLLFAHCCWLPGAHALIAAHEFRSSKALFSVPKAFVKAAPFLKLRDVEREISFPHEEADSLMQIVTAGKDTSGRGFTLSALHLSECAHYKGGEVFSSMLPAVSNHKDTIVVIESTPNGMDGDGEVFYEMWMDAIEKRSEYEAVFLSWTDDPACVADAEIAKNAPVDKAETELLKMGLNKQQLAWRRLKIASPEIGGIVEIFNQEFPVTWEESFITSGYPMFDEKEKAWAAENIKKPKYKGFIDRTTDGTLKLREHSRGDYWVWEDPIPGHYYYMGSDAARGDIDDADKRDFAATVGFNGTTGCQAFRYAGFSVPETHACFINSLGRHYNRAMSNGDLTGGYGYSTLYVLRDQLGYPNLYRWKGKDDKLGGWATGRTAAWFEITGHTRNMLFETFRASLREGAGTQGEYGITIHDELMLPQIRMCVKKDSRADVKKGHDDILFGALLANISVRQWAPPRQRNPAITHMDEQTEEVKNMMKGRGDQILDEASQSLINHFKKVTEKISRFEREDDYDEVGVS